ncbi:hypothetical protein [Stieleria varia]|uniref:hypothetical protein n=1 Tax=Stieleria varia TaxID=2528005 RepID=UPI001E4A3E56|nr:hypothetical protein [Stieleria varia]
MDIWVVKGVFVLDMFFPNEADLCYASNSKLSVTFSEAERSGTSERSGTENFAA